MSQSTADGFFLGVTVLLVFGIVFAYGAFVTPPVNTDINELDVSVNGQKPVQLDGNQTSIYVSNGDNITVTDGNGTDLTKYVYFESQAENSSITISDSGQVTVAEDACNVDYEVIHTPYPHQIPAPTDFTQENFTVTFNGQTTNVTVSCELFGSA